MFVTSIKSCRNEKCYLAVRAALDMETCATFGMKIWRELNWNEIIMELIKPNYYLC